MFVKDQDLEKKKTECINRSEMDLNMQVDENVPDTINRMIVEKVAENAIFETTEVKTQNPFLLIHHFYYFISDLRIFSKQ